MHKGWRTIHLQHKPIDFTGPKFSISKRFKQFSTVVSSTVVSSGACFGSGHRAIYKSQLATLDVHVRKLCRSIVGPSRKVDPNAAWNKVHIWNERVTSCVANAHANTWF